MSDAAEILEKYKDKAIIFTTKEEQVDNRVFKSSLTVIEINKDMFHKIWPGYSPRKGLVNQIGRGMGIEFFPNIRIETIYEEQIVEGHLLKKESGTRIVKQGRRRKPDGTWHTCSPFVYQFNFKDRAREEFLKDEEKTTPKMTFPNNPEKQKKLREKFYLNLKKFSDQRASTGAELGVIRELSGMETGFTENDLKKKFLIVSQIVKSQKLQESEASAKLDFIRTNGGISENLEKTMQLLDGKKDFGETFTRPETTNQPAPEKHHTEIKDEDFQKDPIPPKDPEPPKTPEPKINSNETDTDRQKADPNMLRDYDQALVKNKNDINWQNDIIKQVKGNKYSDAVLGWAIKELEGNS